MNKSLNFVVSLFLILSLSSCGYNQFQTLDEQNKSAWSEVLNQYKRRADLIPNLVKTVEGFADQEKEVLMGVTQARANTSSINVSPEMINNPQMMEQFKQAQSQMSGALSRLLVTVEKYPELKSDQNFRDLQVQLEGTENRITVARNRYIQSVQAYNILARSFPSNLTAKVMGYKPKENFSVANEETISSPPVVDFGK